MDNSVNLGGLTSLLNDYPEDMHELLVEMRNQEEKESRLPEHVNAPPPVNPVVSHLEQ